MSVGEYFHIVVTVTCDDEFQNRDHAEQIADDLVECITERDLNESFVVEHSIEALADIDQSAPLHDPPIGGPTATLESHRAQIHRIYALMKQWEDEVPQPTGQPGRDALFFARMQLFAALKGDQ